ncbi:hypothetical protein AKO1_014095 [Acrasis kona]|uniref:PROP1-like PPR domain-containing protein n=1 Tax=Acrasis kona TaxID=1008807 RepID=A0AAW2Z2F5_9EUKA
MRDPLPLDQTNLINEFKTGQLSPINEKLVVEEKTDGSISIYPSDDPHFARLVQQATDYIEPTAIERIRLSKLDLVRYWDYQEELGHLRRPRTLENYNQLFKACSLVRNSELAVQSFKEMVEDYNISPSPKTFSSLISVFARKSDVDSCLEYIEKMALEFNLKPNKFIYSCLVNAFAKRGSLNEAFDVVQTMMAHKMEPDVVTHSNLLAGCVQNGELTRAWDHWEVMRAEYNIVPDQVAFEIMMNCAAREDAVEKALGLYDEMQILNVPPTEITFNTLIKSVSKSRRDPNVKLRAFALADQMEKYGYKADIYTINSLMHASATTGNVARMKKLLGQVFHEKTNQSTIQGVDPLKPNDITYNIMLNGMCINNKLSTTNHNSNIEAAINTLTLLQKNNMPITNYTMNGVMSVLATANRFSLTLSFLDKFRSVNLTPDQVTYTIIVAMFAKNRRMRDAELTFSKFKELEMKPTYNSYKSMVFGYLKIADQPSAMKYLKKMNEEHGYMLKPSDMVRFKSRMSGSKSEARKKEGLGRETSRMMDKFKRASPSSGLLDRLSQLTAKHQKEGK